MQGEKKCKRSSKFECRDEEEKTAREEMRFPGRLAYSSRQITAKGAMVS